MSSSHTPGPWRLSQPEENSPRDIRGPVGEIVATASRQRNVVGCASHGPQTAEANARLIAAAPDLLDVATWHRDALDLGAVAFFQRHGFNVAEIMPRTRAAIAKATGA